MLFLTIAREPTLRSGSLVPATSQHREAARGPLQEAGARGTAGSEAPWNSFGAFRSRTDGSRDSQRGKERETEPPSFQTESPAKTADSHGNEPKIKL